MWLPSIYRPAVSYRAHTSLVTAVTSNRSAVSAAFIRSGLFARKPYQRSLGRASVIPYHSRWLLGGACRLGEGKGAGIEGRSFYPPGPQLGQELGAELRGRLEKKPQGTP